MAIIRISIAGNDYEVACDDGEESTLKSLARSLDARVRAVGQSEGKSGEAQKLMITGLLLTDELQEARMEIEHLRHDIANSSQSFEKNKQLELEKAVTSTIHHIAGRVEAIAEILESA